MKTKSTLRACAFSMMLLGAALTDVRGQGSLTPPGAPTASMKTLAQVEPRTPISSAPFNITQPGSYYLTTNLTVSTSNAITISANHVTLDLSGFMITSTSPTPHGYGIQMGASRTNITIRNGSIVGSVTHTAGVFSGGGFESGIFITIDMGNTNNLGLPTNVRVSDVNVSGCVGYGIGLGGLGTTVESCTVHSIGSVGIAAGVVRNCSATDCGNTGIAGNVVTDCQARCVAEGGRAISASASAENCYGESQSGVGVFASQSAANCYGLSYGNDYGLYCDVGVNCGGRSVLGDGMRATTSASNCRGLGGSTGLLADTLAENSYGRANTNGTGLLCYGNAINSYGYVPAGNSGVGLAAGQAMNCYGQNDGNGVGLSASVAIGCHGRCYGNNYAISANILNSCIGYRQTGTPTFAFGFKYNMP